MALGPLSYRDFRQTGPWIKKQTNTNVILSMKSFCCTTSTCIFYNGQIESLSWVICGKSNSILVGNHLISLQKKKKWARTFMRRLRRPEVTSSLSFRHQGTHCTALKRSVASQARAIIFNFWLLFASHKRLCVGFLLVVSMALLSGKFPSVFGTPNDYRYTFPYIHARLFRSPVIVQFFFFFFFFFFLFFFFFWEWPRSIF